MFLDMMNHISVSDLSPLNRRHVLYSWDALYSEESISADGVHFPCSWKIAVMARCLLSCGRCWYGFRLNALKKKSSKSLFLNFLLFLFGV